MRTTRIDCKADGWRNVLIGNLKGGYEVDLINFNQKFDTVLCEAFAKQHSIYFTLDTENNAAFFRNQKLNLSPEVS